MCTTVHKWKSEVTLQKLSLSLHHVGHRYWIQVIRLVGNALLSLATSPALTHPFLWTKLMWCPSEPEHRSTSSVSHFNRKPHLSHCSSGWVAPLDQTAPASCRTLGGGGGSSCQWSLYEGSSQSENLSLPCIPGPPTPSGTRPSHYAS